MWCAEVLDWPRLLSGSAADGIARELTAKGARVIPAHGSFIVSMEPALEPGEYVLRVTAAGAAGQGEPGSIRFRVGPRP